MADIERAATPQELENRDCLLFPISGYRNEWKFRKDGADPFKVPVGGHLLISHGMTMTACAASGMGPALLPDWLCRKEIEDGSLIDLFPDHESTATEFDTGAWLIYPSRDYMPLKLRVLIDFLKSEIKSFE